MTDTEYIKTQFARCTTEHQAIIIRGRLYRADEKNFENKIKRYVKQRGGWCLKYWGSGMTRAGVPDLLICIDGMLCPVEVKAQDGRPTRLQLQTIADLRQAGAPAVVLYPSGYDTWREWCEAGFPAPWLPVIVR